LALLIEVLNDPARREALVSMLRSAETGTTAPNGSTAPETPPAGLVPGPGVGPGTGLTPAATSSAPPQESAPPDSSSETAIPTIAAPDLTALTVYLHNWYEQIVWSSGLTTQLPQLWDWLKLQFHDDIRDQWLTLAWQLALVVVAGGLAALLARTMVGRPARRLHETATQAKGLRRLLLLGVRLILKLVPTAMFAVAAQAAIPLTEADFRTELVAATVISALVLLRAGAIVLRNLLAPKDATLRLLPLSDAFAAILHRGLSVIVPALILGYLAVEVARLFGMLSGGRALLSHAMGLVIALATVRTLFRMRTLGKQAIRNLSLGETAATGWVTGLKKGFADIWHLLASAYAVLIFVVWLLDSERWFDLAGWATVKTAMYVTLTLIALGWVQRLRDGAMTRLHRSGRFDRQLRERGRQYLGLTSGTLRALVGIGCLLFITEAWWPGAIAWLSGGLGGRIMGMALNIGLVLLLAVVLWEVVNYAIKRYLSTTDTHGNVIVRGQRERTLLPLLRNVLTVFLVVVVGLILLSELGLDIAPLLAGAGVIGLAIGFGSQKLVQDVITGVFNLLENTIAVGDVVQVGGHSGVVEAMSIRSLRLRDLSGNLHTIPFSGVDTVTNMTKDFSYYLMDIGVAYREDTDQVTQVIRDIGAELQQDPEYGPSILEPVEVLGVDGFLDSAVLIKARIKTKPIMQWWVGREFNRRLKKRFDALGIEIPFPHMTLYFGVDKEGKAPPAHLHVDRLAAMGARAARVPGPQPATDAMPAEADARNRTALLPDPDGDGDGGGDGGR